jgi:hypothetical protein
VTAGGPGTVLMVVRHSASAIDLLKGYKPSKHFTNPVGDLEDNHFSWLDPGERREIFPGDFVVLCPCEEIQYKHGHWRNLWVFYHVLYQKKFTLVPGDHWYGIFEHFMKPLDDKRK